MSALQTWRDELAAGERTTLTFDLLWEAACREIADREFEAYVAPVREALAYREALDTISSGAPIVDRFPALESWRRQVLEEPDEHVPLVRAAAWEVTALELEEEGDIETAAEAYRMAERILLTPEAA